MGSRAGYVCRSCGTHRSVDRGGGFVFDMLHCDQCGLATSLSHQDLGDIRLRFVKGLKVPYAVARAAMDARIQAEYPGEPLSDVEYHAAAEATLDPCSCGGRFLYAGPGSMPRREGSTSESGTWTRRRGTCSMTEHPASFRRLSEFEALRALYVDFEGKKGKPPVLLGVHRRGQGAKPYVHIHILDGAFAGPSDPTVSLRESVENVVARAEHGDRRIVSNGSAGVDRRTLGTSTTLSMRSPGL
ncbi:MAG: hypothetical protein HY264_01415 [Chloroflexi bacterium]|nr:hypothetical protein [Chloroflexota bacterium]